jgi:glycosyltransferase involved in cell wall biosynthesis
MTRPIKVAMVHYRDDATAGGSLRVGETIANHVDAGRVAATMVFAYGGPGPVARRAQVPCHFIGATGPKDFAAWPQARALFNTLDPDIIHFQDGIVWLRAALAGTRAKLVLHIHARMARERLWNGKDERAHPFKATTLLRSYLKFTDAQVCINHGARNALLDLGWIKPATSCVVYNSIEVSRFRKATNQAAARAQLGLPKNVLLVGMIARLVWEKGSNDFLSIMERLPERWQGVICGDGPLRQELQQHCERRGMSRRVHFIGSRDDVVPVYGALDAYAFVSHYEPFGLVLAEAMASGVPVFGIAGDGEFNEPEYPLLKKGITELVSFARQGNYRREVPGEILDRAANSIVNYGEHPARYQEMISKASTWIENCFDAKLQTEAMMRVYENVYVHGKPSQDELTRLYGLNRRRAESLMGENDTAQFAAVTA